MHLAGDANDIGRVAAARSFRVIHVYGAAADRFERVLDKAGFVEGVGVDLHLEIIVIGDAQAAVDASRLLEAEGFLVVAIRPPTVPAGTARLRFAFTAGHPDAEIARLAAVVRNRVLTAGARAAADPVSPG